MHRIAFIIFLAALLSSCATGGTKRLNKQELAELLGPGTHTSLRWSQSRGPDFAVYHGESAPSLSSSVGFYVGTWPSFETAKGDVIHRGRLGMFDVVWHRKHLDEGSLYQTALIQLPDESFIHVWVYGPRESDLDAMIDQLAAIPRFSRRVSQLTL